MPFTQFGPSITSALPALLEAFRRGGGIPFEKLFQNSIQTDEDESQQHKGPVDMSQPLISHDQSPVIAQPGKAPLHLPALAVTGQVGFPARYRLLALGFWNTRLNSSPPQALSQRAAVVPFVCHHFLGTGARSPLGPGYFHPSQSSLRQLHLCWLGAGHQPTNGYSLILPHQLAPLATTGQPYFLTPFLAGTKLPSKKARLQFSLPCLSRVLRKALQILSQMPSICHWSNLRQQVTGAPQSRRQVVPVAAGAQHVQNAVDSTSVL